MSINRTREQKVQAAMRRVDPQSVGGSITLRVGEVNKLNISRELVLPVKTIKQDLMKTIFITGVAILVQITLLLLLNRGVVKIPGV